MEPGAATRFGERRGAPNELGPDATPPMRDIDRWIEEERVLAAIGGEVHEPDELTGVVCRDGAEAVGEHASVRLRAVIWPGAREERVECGIIEWRIDAIIDCVGSAEVRTHVKLHGLRIQRCAGAQGLWFSRRHEAGAQIEA